MRGTVVWFNNKLGYGILETVNREDIFVHYSEVQGTPKTLYKDQQVNFELYDTPKGLMARNVRKVE
jgi:CspA family cold shock protein